MANKLSHTQLTRFLADPRWSRSPVEMPIPPSNLAEETYVPRLTWKSGPRVKEDGQALIDSLKDHSDVALFLDTSFVSREIQFPLWDELLREPGRLYIIGRVARELAPHFASVPDHPLRKAVSAKNPAIVPHSEPSSDVASSAMLYYLNLLCNRRTLRDRAIARHKREHKVPPNKNELARIEGRLQRDFGERGQLLYTKAISPIFTDEVLVFLAVEHAVRTGQHTIILTGDRDVEDQFFKMIELLTMHYLAMLVAREYVQDCGRFRPRALPEDVAKATGLFTSATLLSFDVPNLQSFHPRTPSRFVSIATYLKARQYVSHLPYGAETAMAEVLDIKGHTRGRSTDLLGDRDMHVYCLPEIRGEQGYDAIVSHDVVDTIPDANVRLAKLDSLFAIQARSNMAVVVSAPTSDRVALRQRRRRPSR